MYPVWIGEFSVSTSESEEVEYKFVKIGDKQAAWEQIPNNRVVDIRQRVGIVVQEIFGLAEKRAETFVRRPA